MATFPNQINNRPIPDWRFPKIGAWSAVNQLPRRTPSFFNPLTRLTPTGASALRSRNQPLRKPDAAQTPSRRLTVPGAKPRDSR
jgi:hypothetical protein